ncbi:MAG: NUDIX hydrolase [Candidatus Velthaea sp.]
MSRTALLAELAAYSPSDARERSMVAEVAAFVRAHEACFERSLATGHITASAWIVEPTATYALLTHHRKLNRWLQLGGHADGDADVRAVALREACEESGLAAIRLARPDIYDVDVHVIPRRGAEAAHKHYDVRFAFVAHAAAALTVSGESHELAWRPIAALTGDDVDASVRRMAHKTPGLLPL